MTQDNFGEQMEQEAVLCENYGEEAQIQQVPVEIVGQKDPGQILGIIALVCGVLPFLMVLFSCAPYIGTLIGFLTPMVAIASIVVGIIGNIQSKAAGFKNTFAKIGMILGIVFVAIGIVATVILLVLLVNFMGLGVVAAILGGVTGY